MTADRNGNACVLTTSLGLGSGDFVPGFQLHLNSMLGEADLIVGPLVPGERMESMMAPTAAFDADGPVLAIGSAGGSRLRSAIVQTTAGTSTKASTRRRPSTGLACTRAGPVVHVEPGFPEEALTALGEAGFEVRRWDARHHYFGGVSLCARRGAAADPRRSGSAAACCRRDRHPSRGSRTQDSPDWRASCGRSRASRSAAAREALDCG